MKIQLPIDSCLPQIRETLAKSRSLVVSAAPGAGKTTRLPPAILSLTDKQVWVLEPRRIAAVAAAHRIAEENGWQVGRQVGYQVRFDNKSSKETRLLFLTEALLMRKLLQDPELTSVGAVILDEFHERSLHVDLALGALKELQELARPDLKIVVMSATLNAEPLSHYLEEAPVFDVPGRTFPLHIRYDDKAQLLRTGPEFTERMKKLVQKAMTENPEGDLLCFLPGQGEIERLREALAAWTEAQDFALFTLHGRLGLHEQKAALQPQPGRRKIVLATNVAESSLTVEGVRLVVDSGLARLAQIHPRTGFESLDLVRISKASATQRAGRAARTGPGTVYRAWTTHDELSMKEFELAEIFRSDLSESLLLLAALGVTNFDNFSWFEPPTEKSIEQARKFLLSLGALEDKGGLSALGRKLQEFPLHPRLAKLLVVAGAQGRGREAAELAALLSERDSRNRSGVEAENDLLVRWEDWKRSPNQPKSLTLKKTAEQLERLVDGKQAPGPVALEKWIPDILLEIYPDRLCRRRRPREPQAKMAGGRGVKLHPDSSVKNSEFFLAVELSEGRDAAETLVFQAVGVPAETVEKKILPQARPESRIEWDDEKNRFLVVETREWNGLSVSNEHRRPAKPEEVSEQLVDVVWSKWDQLLDKNEDLAQWILRLRALSKMDPRWPLLTEEELRKGLELACYGEHSLDAVFQKDLIPFFERLLEEEERKALARECPSSWTVPTGNRMKIRYSEEQGAQVEVRLQELFGLKAAPKVAGQNLTLVLLAPNFRPVQVTRDLESFWKNGYPEVRKEMRARYPKHSWPEDPLTAPPQSKGRPR
jgi:ATP-dependent helicase HrpB